jgi:hypothetical protein
MLPFLFKSGRKESEVKPSILYALYSIIYYLRSISNVYNYTQNKLQHPPSTST